MRKPGRDRVPPIPHHRIAPLAAAQLSRPEIARVLDRTVGQVDKHLRALNLGTTGEEVTRERAWLALGHLVVRDHAAGGTRWTNAARSWEGAPMSAPYLEALLAAGLLVRVETAHTETYRHADRKAEPDGDG